MAKKFSRSNKKTKINLIIILVVVLVAAILFFNFMPKTEKDGFGFSVIMYDKEGNVIKQRQPFAIVGPSGGLGTPGVAGIRLRVAIENTGAESLTCNLIGDGAYMTTDTNTNYFGDSMTDDTDRVILSGQTGSWTTDIIDVETISIDTEVIANLGEVNFGVKPYCFGQFGAIGNQPTDTLTLTILPEGTPQGTANIEINQISGTVESFCGDNVCDDGSHLTPDIGENPTLCPVDCSTTFQKVKFRTTEVSFGLHSAIGFTETQGNTLLGGFGRASTSGCTSGTADYSVACPSVQDYTNVFGPISKFEGWGWGTGNMCLYKKNTDATVVRLYQKVGSSGSPCLSSMGRGAYYDYKTTDTDAAYLTDLSPNANAPGGAPTELIW